MASILPQKTPSFNCNNCNFITGNKKDLTRHLLTSKHKNASKCYKNASKLPIVKNNCVCGKEYKHESSFYRHKKKCTQQNSDNLGDSNQEITPQLILSIIQQNQELQQILIEQNKTMLEISKNSQINNTINNNNSNNNSNNKTFNLQVFLNETCKDAMNIMDFVDSIKIQLCDIESIGELGFVNGMSKLIIKHLNALDENMRPVHCNDLKRESLFVKDGNVWEKEDANNNKLKKAIKYIAHKNICALPEWRKKYPDCEYSDSKKSDQYNHIVIEAMGGSGDNDDEKADKIISKIAKTITIDKSNS
jgi:hypothetical protein